MIEKPRYNERSIKFQVMIIPYHVVSDSFPIQHCFIDGMVNNCLILCSNLADSAAPNFSMVLSTIYRCFKVTGINVYCLFVFHVVSLLIFKRCSRWVNVAEIRVNQFVIPGYCQFKLVNDSHILISVQNEVNFCDYVHEVRHFAICKWLVVLSSFFNNLQQSFFI